jgi:hypothetical protein
MIPRGRLGLTLLAGLAALPLSGCQRLCDAGAITWCPRAAGDELNDPPRAEILVRSRAVVGSGPLRRNVHGVGERLVFVADAQDPDGDQMLFEWDLDQDGEFERAGEEVSRVYTRTGSVTVKLRVSDFPTELGAPGEAIATARRCCSTRRTRPIPISMTSQGGRCASPGR